MKRGASIRSVAGWSAACIWAQVAIALLAVYFDWSVAWVLAASGVGALLATWILLAGVLTPREEAYEALERAVTRAGEALGLPGPTEESGGPDASIAALASRVEAVDRAVRDRVPAQAVDLANRRAVFDALADPVLATDERGRVVLANRAAEEFFSARSLPVAGKRIEELFTQADVMDLHAEAWRGRAGRAQIRVTRGGSPKVYEVLSTPVALLARGAGESPSVPFTGVLLSLRDVTEHALAVQLKTDFVANASHELRTPLASIKAAAETMRDGARDDPAMIDRLAGMVASNAARLEDLVRDLLDLSRLETPEAPVRQERFHLRDLCESVRAMFEGVCRERSLEIAVDVAPDADEVEGDRELLGLIVKNLVDNATKFAFERTTIRVEGRRAEGGRLRVRVIDRGIGIPYGQQQRIFERFYQVDLARSGAERAPEVRRGTGLGLAIVKHAVRRLGGTIRVESVWKEGTTMTVEVPIGGPVAGGPPEDSRTLQG